MFALPPEESRLPAEIRPGKGPNGRNLQANLDEPARLLVVDDEPGVREGCRRVLTEENYLVDVAASGEEGLELLRQQNYDVVFVDVKMPGMDGLEFLTAAAQLPQESVFVVITAYATLGMAVEATKRGAYDFVAKPFTPDELVTLTRRALEHSRLMRERNRLYEERERRLLELATEKGRLRSIVEAMSDGVLVTNRDNQIVLYNAAAPAMLHCPLPAGQPLLQESPLPSELIELISTAARHLPVERRSREIRVGEKPHEVVVATVSPVLDEAGACLGVVTVLHDISEMKKIELIKAQFVNMVAHELRAPVAAVDAQIQAIIKGYVPEAGKQQELLERAHQRLQALLELVNDLLTISRAEAGTIQRDIRPLDLASLAREACQMMEALAQEHGVRVTWDIKEPLPALNADAQEIQILLQNLLSNAIKYNRPSGSVHVRVFAEAPYAVIQVSDTGVGISPEGLRRIGEEFFREKNEMTRQVPGTGLGLSIVSRIVKSYHGQLEVESELGKGSTFTIRLPFKQSSNGSP